MKKQRGIRIIIISLVLLNYALIISGRSENLNNEYKDLKQKDDKPKVRIGAINGENSACQDEAVVYICSSASWNFSNKYDAKKLMNTDPAYPNIYFEACGYKLTIKGLPEIKESYVLPIVVNVKIPGLYYLTIKEYSNFPENTSVYITDTLSNSKTVLYPGYELPLMFSDDETEKKFYLKFKQDTLGIGNINDRDKNIEAYFSGGEMIVTYKILQENDRALISLYNQSGQCIVNNNRLKEGINKFRIKSCAGLIIIRIQDGDGIYYKKIFIENN